jgi:hypothetical protein
VNDNSKAVAASVVGAVIGGIAGYLFFTEAGRTMRRQLEPALDDFARELNSFRSTVAKAAGVASEGWKLLNEAIGEDNRNRLPSPHQTAPF